MQRNANVIKLLSDMVAIDSQSQKGNLAIISFLSDLLKDYEQTRQPWVREQDDVKGENLIVKIPGKSAVFRSVWNLESRILNLESIPTRRTGE